MKRFTFGLGVIIAGLALAAPPALAQNGTRTGGGGGTSGARSGGESGGGMAVPRAGGGVSAPASSGSASSNSGSSSAGPAMPSMSSPTAAAPRQAAPMHRSTGFAAQRSAATPHAATSYAMPRGASAATAGSGARVPPNQDTGAVPSWARPRGNNATSDTAVPRNSTTPRPAPGNTTIFVPYPGYCYSCGVYGGPTGYYGYYDPFYGQIYSPFMGFGMGLGLAGYPMFDPGYPVGGDDYNYGVGSYSTSQSGSHEEGNLKLKVKPRSAKVTVDGYFVGVVDEFDGAFQKLPLTAGRHHVKIEADGYQTDEFDAVITPGQTVTFQGALKKLQ